MGDFLSGLVRLLPFGYAFGAGILTMLSPCGIALLPPYVSMHLGGDDEEFYGRPAWQRWARAVKLSVAMTAGIALLLALVGTVVSLGGRALTAFIPWLAVAIGAGLVVTGVWLLAGGHVYAAAFSRLAGRMGNSRQRPFVRFLLFGVVYGIGALSCTFPVFLAVVGGALASRSFTAALLQFMSYALGMGAVALTVTVGVAFFREAIQRWAAGSGRYVARLSGVLLVGSGVYILYYWFKVGGLLG